MTDPAFAPAPSLEQVSGPLPEWSVHLLQEDDAFAAVEDEWEDLYVRCGTATPFQCHAWLDSWWREYGVPGRLRVVLVRRDGQLVGAASLHLASRGPWRVLVPLGGDLSDYHDILLDPDCSAETASRLAAALLAEPSWQVLDVRQVRSGAAMERLYEVWPGPRWNSPGTMCLEIRAGSLEEFLDGLPKQSRKTLRKKLRKLQSTGIESGPTPDAEVPRAVRTLLDLHEQQWRGRAINPEHLQPRFARHLSAALTRMVAGGQAELTEYRLEGRVVIGDINVIGRDFIGMYLAGFEPGMRKHIDVAVLMLSRAFALSGRLGHPVLSLLRGEEEYKMRWRPVLARNQRLLLARTGRTRTAAVAYAGLVRARVAADAAIQRAPWLRSARKGSHTVRVVQDADGQEIGRVALTGHAREMSWTVTQSIEQALEPIFGEGWMDR